jgi:hypothetical protein
VISRIYARVPTALRPVLALIAALLLVPVLILLPRPLRPEHVVRPPHSTVVAAIRTGKYEEISGRVVSLDRSGFVVRALLGTRMVARIHHTVFTGSSGSSLPRAALRQGDEVKVGGFLSGDVLIAVTVQDASRT